MKKKGKVFVALLVVLLAGLYYYIALPAINIHSSDTWFFVIALLIVLTVLYAVKKKVKRGEVKQNKILHALIYMIIGLGIVYLIGAVLSSPIVNAKKYQQLMTV